MTHASRLLLLSVAAVVIWTALPAAMAAAEAVVTIRAIRGTNIVGAEDVELSEKADAPGAYTKLEDVVGKEAKVTLYPGRPVLKGQIGPPAIVERNGVVKMLYLDGPLSIMTDGRVLDRGGIGEIVRVMNLTSRQVVSGTVEPDGSIKVSQ
jgi:flagellar basal body P-ring formation protein FlgA